MKSTSRLTNHMNAYTSQIIKWVFLIHIYPKQDMVILGEDNNVLDHFGPYENEKSTLKVQNIEENHSDLITQSSDIGGSIKNSLSEHIPQDELLKSKLLLSLREVKIGDQEFATDTSISNIIYNYL